MPETSEMFFPPRAARGTLDFVVSDFPFPLALTYARLHEEMDRQEPIAAAWQLRDAFECLLKFTACVAIADYLHAKSEGKQRYQCRACRLGRGRTFLLAYAYAGLSPAVKQQIVDMAMHASGIRDTARVLHVSPTTVIKELKKRHLHSSR